MASFHLHNFGCRANQAEGAAMAAALERAGLQRTEVEQADWVVLNTCTVTAEADREARRTIRKLRRERPQAKIAVMGCYAERAGAELAALDGVALVAGRGEQATLAQRLAQDLVPLQAPGTVPKLAALARIEPAAAAGRTRPIVKVQEGCGRACSFCVIPRVRGASVSRPLGGVLAEIAALAAAGHAEVVVSGINLGQWGRDLEASLRLEDLVRSILEQTALPRLRLSSVEPVDWSPALTALLAAHAGRWARHVHLPLQSGSDSVLARMHRRYRAGDYAARVAALAQAVPGVAIGADVMTGFPGESEAEFAASCALIEQLPLAYLHVFPFSPRPGTEAARQLAAGAWRSVPPSVATARARVLRRLADAKRSAFLDGLVGQTLSAVALAGGEAITDNYARLRLDRAVAPGAMVAARILARRGDILEAACLD